MADQLYLSLWFPNFRLESLPGALLGVLRQFSVIGGEKRVAAASAYPIDFTETPTYQRIYVNDARAAETADTAAAMLESAVAEATEQMHDDMAYEFEMRWNLWSPDVESSVGMLAAGTEDEEADEEELDDTFDDVRPREPKTPRDRKEPIPFPVRNPDPAAMDAAWKQRAATVRVIGFGPEFDQGGFEQNGHIRVDFGLDTPWTLDEEDLDRDAANHIQRNVEMLLAFTLLVEKHCGISSRLLWTESGEPLAEKLIARLQRVN